MDTNFFNRIVTLVDAEPEQLSFTASTTGGGTDIRLGDDILATVENIVHPSAIDKAELFVSL